MDKAKEEADDGKTPFERMTDFAKKIVRVPKAELPKPERKQKRRTRQHNPRPHGT